jgi:putative ABC transport system permease protein
MRAVMSTLRWLLIHFVGGYARTQPLRAIVTVLAIAVGVALGYAVHLINASALAEFAGAVRTASGEADATIAGSRAGFDEQVFARALADRAVELANPVLEVDVPVVAPGTAHGQLLTIVGVDVLRAAQIAPQWIGRPAADASNFALLGEGVFLSPAALELLQPRAGQGFTVQAGDRAVRLPIAGSLPGARAGAVVAAMDLGFAQWRLNRLGVLTRIDLKLAPGTDLAALRERLALPPGVFLQAAEDAGARVSNLTRAYRVNLNVLALVALFTGAFLVYSLQAQAVAVRRTQLAFLRVLGATARDVERLLVLEAALLGAVGAALGVAAGVGIAALALRLLGGDLGGGYFAQSTPPLAWSPWSALLFFALGIAAAALGGYRPAHDAARAAPAPLLKASGSFEDGLGGSRAWLVALLFGGGALLLWLPPVGGIPLAAYLAVAAWLIGTIALKPLIAPPLFAPLAAWANAKAAATSAPCWLAATRLATTPRFAAIGAAGVVASFALMVAMATMVASFRHSVDEWLGRVLPADLYARAGPAGGAAAFSARDLEQLRSHPAVVRAEFARSVRLQLDPQRAPVTLIARAVDRGNPAVSLPLTGQAAAWREGLPPPVWISEAVVSLYDARVGGSMKLPLAGRTIDVFIAGVWRDYARQGGSIVIDAADYERIVGDTARTDVALWLREGFSAASVARELAAQIESRSAEFAEPGEIRALSLRIFDRSFAVTYVLELAAIAIGLIGIATTFSAQAIARTREFGMLRHVGVARGQILAMLAFEALLVTALALVLGLVAGLAVSWVLIAIVNPQSFHWTMTFRLPGGFVAALCAALLVTAAVTAVVAGRRAVSIDAVRAVREDW